MDDELAERCLDDLVFALRLRIRKEILFERCEIFNRGRVGHDPIYKFVTVVFDRMPESPDTDIPIINPHPIAGRHHLVANAATTTKWLSVFLIVQKPFVLKHWKDS